MKLYLGQVQANDSGLQDGIIYVKRLQSNVQYDPVIYTSPFGTNHTPDGRGGFFAFPSPQQIILYAETNSLTETYFYISTIHGDLPILDLFAKPSSSKKGKFKSSELPDGKRLKSFKAFPDGMYNVSGYPEKVVIQDPKGNKISLNHYADDREILTGITLKSSRGKRLNLGDNPNGDAVRLLNEEDDGLIISGEYKTGYQSGPLSSPRSVEVRALKNIDIKAETGRVSMKSAKGGGVEIEAGSFGDQQPIPALPFAGPLLVPPTGPLFQPYGNVRIESLVRDVCIYAGKTHKGLQTLGALAWPPILHRSRVMMRAYGLEGKVQILSDGSIILRAVNDNVYIHGANIHIKGENSVNIHSKGQINMLGTSIKLSTTGPNDVVPRTSSLTDLLESDADKTLHIADTLEFFAPGIPLDPGAPVDLVRSHIELSPAGVTVDGLKIDLAPIVAGASTYAKRAINPNWELSDYELQDTIPGNST